MTRRRVASPDVPEPTLVGDRRCAAPTLSPPTRAARHPYSFLVDPSPNFSTRQQDSWLMGISRSTSARSTDEGYVAGLLGRMIISFACWTCSHHINIIGITLSSKLRIHFLSRSNVTRRQLSTNSPAPHIHHFTVVSTSYVISRGPCAGTS